MIAVAGDLVSSLGNSSHRIGISFGYAATRQESGFYIHFIEHAQNSPDSRFRSVFPLSIILVIHFAVWSRPHRLASLKVERDGNGDALVSGPSDFALCMVLNDHNGPPKIMNKESLH
jgi:hypothetical protein